MDRIVWHRRETSRITEKPNTILSCQRNPSTRPESLPVSYDFASVHALQVKDGELSGAADILYGGGMALIV